MTTKKRIATRKQKPAGARIDFDVANYTPENKAALDKLEADVKAKAPATRDEAAAIVRAHGFDAYKGGRHVAVLEPNTGARLAMVLNDTPDFS